MSAPYYYVYVLQNPEGRLYIGFTTDLEKRVRRHQEDKAGWTHGKGQETRTRLGCAQLEL